MKPKYLIQLMLAATLAGPLSHCRAAAIDPLTPAQLAGEAAFGILLAADHSQTRQIQHFCEGRVGCTLHEVNPLLGSSPGPSRVRNYFLTAALTHATVLVLLPTEYRAAFLASTIALEAVVVGRNKRLGLRVQF